MSDKVISLIRLALIMATLVVTLWLNASKFDETELRTIIVVFLTAGCGEGILNQVRGRK